MTDTVSKARRSEIMAAVRGKDTRPEIALRKLTHSMGYRYRLHRKDLPGTPDLVFPSRRKVVFLHGCFWHRHAGCSAARIPKSRTDFWLAKLEANRVRDGQSEADLRQQGWDVLVVWECELRDHVAVRSRLADFLG